MDLEAKIRRLFAAVREGVITLEQAENVLVVITAPKPRKNAKRADRMTAKHYQRGRYYTRLRGSGESYSDALAKCEWRFQVSDRLILKDAKQYQSFRERHRLTKIDRRLMVRLAKWDLGGDRETRYQIRRIRESEALWSKMEWVFRKIEWPESE